MSNPEATLSVNRRGFLGVLGLGLGAALSTTRATLAAAADEKTPRSDKGKRILILGGTGFIGPATVEVARSRGHQVTLFNRGRTRPGLFPEVEKLHGDRDPDKGEGLKALSGKTWDVVIDNSGFYPRMVKASAELLAPHIKQYIYISSISAYAELSVEGANESAALASLKDPTVETMGKNYENYGGLKAACEQAVERALPGRSTLVRPGYIVGPDDPTGRFTYWPVRFDRGGEVAVPGTPNDPLQVIDVRDLAVFLVLLAEKGALGAFNACGPDKPVPMRRVVAACQKAARVGSSVVWLPEAFLRTLGEPEELFPIWAPYAGKSRGTHTLSNARAVKAGLRFRPFEQTVKDTLAWYKSQVSSEDGRVKLAGPSPADEAQWIAKFKAESKAQTPKPR